MTRLMTTLKAVLIAGAGASFFILAPAAAKAAQCGSTAGAHRGSVTMCGPLAQYDDDDDDDADDDEDDDVADDEDDDEDDDGSLFVDVEDCEPGKYWMMDLDDEIPMPCR